MLYVIHYDEVGKATEVVDFKNSQTGIAAQELTKGGFYSELLKTKFRKRVPTDVSISKDIVMMHGVSFFDLKAQHVKNVSVQISDNLKGK